MSTWAKKVEENWFIEILHAKGFVQEKKLAKNLYLFLYPLESLKISCLISIQLDKNLNLQELKQLFIEIFPYFKQTQHHLLALSSTPSEEIQSTLKDLDMGLLDFASLLLSLFPLSSYQEYLRNHFKTPQYMVPWIYQHNTRIELVYFIKKLQEIKEGLIILEGEKGIGKTTFAKYLCSYLGLSISSEVDNNWIIPFYISMQLFKEGVTVQKYIEYQIFNPDIISPFTKERFELLLKHRRVLLVIDSIELVAQKSSLLLEETLLCIMNYTFLGAKVIVTTQSDFFFYQYQKKIGFKFYFEQLFPKDFVIRYQLKPFTLLQIKQQNDKPKIQRAIEYNEIVKNFAKYPAILELIKDFSVEQIEQVQTMDNFFEIILDSWKEVYLSRLGKETILEFIAEYNLNQKNFYMEDTPSYMENFLLVQFRDAPVNLESLRLELVECPFLEYFEGSFYFKHPIFIFYFIKTKLILEISRNNLKDIFYLRHTFLLELLTKEEIQNTILSSLEREITHLSFKEKGLLFELWVRISKFLQAKEDKVPITILELENLSLNYEFFGALIFKNNTLSSLKAYYTDFCYTEWENVDLSFSYLRNSNLSHSKIKNSKIVLGDWKFLLAKNIHVQNQDFIEMDMRFSNYSASVFLSCQFLETHLEGSHFQNCQWTSVEFKETFFSFTKHISSYFTLCLWKGEQQQYNSIILAESFIKESLWSHLEMTRSDFYATQWENTRCENLVISHTTFAFSVFQNVKLENVVFSKCDLRGVKFQSSQLINVQFLETDTRDLVFDSKTSLCKESKESLEQNLF